MGQRPDPDAHRKQVRRANQARDRAARRLIAENQVEYDGLYQIECAAVFGDPECGGVLIAPKGREPLDEELAVEIRLSYLYGQLAAHHAQLAEERAVELGMESLDGRSWPTYLADVKQPARDAELQEVARVYREHVGHAPVRAVEWAMGYTSRGIAERRVRWARRAGYLPPVESRVVTA